MKERLVFYAFIDRFLEDVRRGSGHPYVRPLPHLEYRVDRYWKTNGQLEFYEH
jgi:hypothetical protein